MTVRIDTNVVPGMFTASHAYRPIFEEWFCGRLQWAVSTEILLKYEEIMQRKASPQKADAMRRSRITRRLPNADHHSGGSATRQYCLFFSQLPDRKSTRLNSSHG